MNCFKLFLVFGLSFLIVETTMAGGKRKRKRKPRPSICTKFNDGPCVKVNFLVAKDNEGKGNQKWTDKTYVENILNAASQRSQFANFYLGNITVKKNSSLYNNKNQYPTLKLACRYAASKTISVGISGEKTTPSVGLAFQAYRRKPCFALRSRYNNAGNEYNDKAYQRTAYDFLHELGHNFNLKHGNQVKKGKIHTENYLNREDGKKKASKYINRVTRR